MTFVSRGILAGMFVAGCFFFSVQNAFAATATIQALNPGNSVTAKNRLTFDIANTGFTSPTFRVTDSLSGTTFSTSNISPVGSVNWTPSIVDVGSHLFTFTVSDSDGNYATVQQSITVLPPPSITVQSISPGAVVLPGQKFTFAVVSNGFSNPTYVLGDMFSNGSTIDNKNIDASGNFSWTPDVSQNGEHYITVYAMDSQGRSATAKVSVRVGAGPTLTVQSLSPSQNVTPGQFVSFSMSALNFMPTGYMVLDSFKGSTISNSNINASGYFAWNPQPSDIGNHSILITGQIGAYGQSATTSVNITVLGLDGLPVATPQPSLAGSAQASSSALSALQAQLALLQTQIAAKSTPASTSYVFDTYLKPNSSGEAVLQLQKVLAQHGYLSVTPNGNYGPTTTEAVKKFQTANGLDALGVVGPATRAALNALSAPAASQTPVAATTGSRYVFEHFMGVGDDDPDVLELQKRLASLGYLSSALTGYYGTVTESAVKKFQTAQGLTPTGYVDRITRAALNK